MQHYCVYLKQLPERPGSSDIRSCPIRQSRIFARSANPPLAKHNRTFTARSYAENGSEATGSASTAPASSQESVAQPIPLPPRHRHPKPTKISQGPTIIVERTLPRVLLLHTGGTLGMAVEESYAVDSEGHFELKAGTGGKYERTLRPGRMLSNILTEIPELQTLAQLDLQVTMNRDSSNIGPKDWMTIAKKIHINREKYDAFLIVHGTDTLSFTAAALSLMLAGLRKPIVLTGSQIPLALPRSDARQNLLDAITCATAAYSPPHVQLNEVAVCFGGKLLRGNRAQKVNTTQYQAFDSPSYPPLAQLGVSVDFNKEALLQPTGVYRPRFLLEPRVIRIPIVPGSDPRTMYGDLAARGVKGVVLEAFGVGNMPDKTGGWLPWLRAQRKQGVAFYMRSQSSLGPLAPHLYHSGAEALKLGVEAGPQMTPEAAVVKMMLCLMHPHLPVSQPLAGEL